MGKNFWFCILLCLVFFALDLSLPLGVAGGIPYVIVVLVSLGQGRSGRTIAFAVVASILILADVATAEFRADPWIVLVNRSMALLALWTVTVLALQRLSQEQQIRALSHRLIEVRETEADRVAHELHEEVAQQLVVLKLQAENARSTAPASLQEHFSAMQAGLNEMLGNLRRITHDLRRGHSPILSLSGSLREIARIVESAGLRVRLDLDERIAGPGQPSSIHISRIIFEALENIQLHTKATEATVRARLEGESYVFAVSDNAPPASQVLRPGMGIQLMHERASILGGRFELRNERGVEVVLTVPRSSAGSEPERGR